MLAHDVALNHISNASESESSFTMLLLPSFRGNFVEFGKNSRMASLIESTKESACVLEASTPESRSTSTNHQLRREHFCTDNKHHCPAMRHNTRQGWTRRRNPTGGSTDQTRPPANRLYVATSHAGCRHTQPNVEADLRSMDIPVYTNSCANNMFASLCFVETDTCRPNVKNLVST